MPVYEYQCQECGHIEEAFQKISEAPLEHCSQCKGGLKKLISHSTFHLKGSGWYVTDYGGSKSGANSSGNKQKSESKSEKTTSKVESSN
ncbi:MAG: FmdB family transcriptional regulator [Desulfobacterales bacterium]|nr:MAG: FmdB family transcriptional regulator [Desulfobacterales bacterium]